MIEQTHPELGRQDPQHRLIENGDVRAAVGEPVRQFVGERQWDMELGVEAGRQGEQARVRVALSHALYGVQIADGAVVGDGHTVEAHLVPQQFGEDARRSRDRFASDGAVARHDAPQPG